MTCRQAMSQTAAHAAHQLESTAVEEMAAFVRGQQNKDGGFRGRSETSDLYYTVFGLECAVALGFSPVESVRSFLDAFGDGDGLDFIHLTCLARCRSQLPDRPGTADRERAILERLETYRCPDGGFAQSPKVRQGTVYESFLAFLAYEDLEVDFCGLEALESSVEKCRIPDGSYANQSGLSSGTTPVTAAAAVLLERLGRPVETMTTDWLLARCHPQGGFLATPETPLPDLLSTATALHALTVTKRSIAPVRAVCLDFVQSLWTEGGGFCGHWADDTPDCEYTFYGLLALGSLSL